MKVRIDDKSTFQTVSFLDLTAYLRASGWKEIDAEGTTSLWEFVKEENCLEVLVPKNESWRDYPTRVQEVFRVLGDVEERSELAILRDVGRVSSDAIRLRASNNGGNDGTILLSDAVQLSASGRGMLAAAACSADRPRRAYHSRKPSRVIRYVDSLRLDQSERGSYIFTILSPVAPALRSSQTNFDFPGVSGDPTEPFSRKVTRTLVSALGLLVDLSERGIATGEMTAFEDAVEQGISADLCESLSLINEAHRVDSVDVSILWAPTRPFPGYVNNKVTLSRGIIEVVAEAGRRLREKEPTEDFELTGPVLKVERENDTSEGRRGTVVIYGMVAGKPRKVSLLLEKESWDLAHAALADRHQLFRCVGELVRVGNQYRLQSPRRVELADDEQV